MVNYIEKVGLLLKQPIAVRLGKLKGNFAEKMD